MDQEEIELARIMSLKNDDSVTELCYGTCSEEDSEDSYQSMLDGMLGALRACNSKKKVWAVKQIDFNEYEDDEEDFDDPGYFHFFIDDSFDEIKKKMQALPNA